MSKGIWKGYINRRMHIETTFMIGDYIDENIAGSLVDTSER